LGARLYHFSEDPGIERFEPHVPATNPGVDAAVWAIDEAHAPLYWFPRDCPRVTAWPRSAAEEIEFRAEFGTSAHRLHAIELAWLPAMRTTVLYRYTFEADAFETWAEASGQWISDQVVKPVAVEPVGDLLDLHVEAGIELRAVPSLLRFRDLAVDDRWDFSVVRLR
jgi:hypothetical protein